MQQDNPPAEAPKWRTWLEGDVLRMESYRAGGGKGAIVLHPFMAAWVRALEQQVVDLMAENADQLKARLEAAEAALEQIAEMVAMEQASSIRGRYASMASVSSIAESALKATDVPDGND